MLLNTGVSQKKYVNNKQFFPDKIFSLTIRRLLVNSLAFPWQLSNSPTYSGFPEKWSPKLYKNRKKQQQRQQSSTDTPEAGAEPEAHQK